MKKFILIIAVLSITLTSCEEGENYDVTVAESKGKVNPDDEYGYVQAITQGGKKITCKIEDSLLVNHTLPFKARMLKYADDTTGYIFDTKGEIK